MQIGHLSGSHTRIFAPRALLSWWRDGLLACFPSRLRKWLRANRATLVLDATDPNGTLRARLERPGEAGEDFGTVAENLTPALARARQARAEIQLLLAPEWVLCRELYLPAQVRENLPQVMNYELDRLTPFVNQEVYATFHLLPTAIPEQLHLELAVVRRTVLEQWLERLNSVAASPTAVTWPGAWPGANLLPAELRPRPARVKRWMRGFIGVLVLGLLAAVLISPLWQKRAVVLEITAQLEKTRNRAEQVTALRTRVEQAEIAAQAVVQQKRTAPVMITLLLRLTELIPDHAWVNQFNYATGQVDFRGESRQASALIELLAREPSFHNITFKSPLTGIQGQDKERFHIQFDYATADTTP